MLATSQSFCWVVLGVENVSEHNKSGVPPEENRDGSHSEYTTKQHEGG